MLTLALNAATHKPGPIPQEAIDYLKAKGVVPGDAKVWKEEHNYAFTVARITELDVLSDVKASLEKALKLGQTFEEWSKGIESVLDESGWSDFGEEDIPPYRLAIVYDTNMRTAHSVGQWQRIQRTKLALPYLQYNLGPSTHHREEHEAWDGTILPADHPWWATHFTPNGYGCKCWVRQLTRAEAESEGVTEDVPEGEPDEGWDYNPGQERADKLAEALGEAENEADGAELYRLLSLCQFDLDLHPKDEKGRWTSKESGGEGAQPTGGAESEAAAYTQAYSKYQKEIKEWDSTKGPMPRPPRMPESMQKWPQERASDAGKWYASLPQDGQLAYRTWRGSGYASIRQGEAEGASTPEQEKAIKDFNRALETAPSYSKVLYRGLSDLSPEALERVSTVGAVLTDKATSSWTPKETTAKDFTGGSAATNRVLLHLNKGSTRARLIDKGSSKQGEAEAVVLKNSPLRVVEVRTEGSLRVVVVEEVK